MKIKLDSITELEIDEKGWLVLTQYDNNYVALSPENIEILKKQLKLSEQV